MAEELEKNKAVTLGDLRQRLREKEEEDEKWWDKKNKEKDDDKDDKEHDKDDDKKDKDDKEKKSGKKEDMKEDTAAADSIKAHKTADASTDDPKAISPSKVEMMKNVVNYMAGQSKKDLTGWFDQMMSQYGPGKDYGVGDNSAKNAATIDTTLGKGPKTKDPMPKLSATEDLEAIFSGTELSEDFKEKTSALFEAAVSARISLETARLEEEFVEMLTEEIESFTSGLTDKLDSYLDYVVENWMVENIVAMDSALRTELAMEFLSGIKELFVEHFYDLPEEKVEVVEAMADKIETLEQQNHTLVTEITSMKDAMVEASMLSVIDEVAKGLTLVEKEKFGTLIEGIEFEGDFETYANKLTVVRNNYFKETSVKPSNILDVDDEENSINEEVNPAVANYVTAISRTTR
jgi:hypothetical protein